MTSSNNYTRTNSENKNNSQKGILKVFKIIFNDLRQRWLSISNIISKHYLLLYLFAIYMFFYKPSIYLIICIIFGHLYNNHLHHLSPNNSES